MSSSPVHDPADRLGGGGFGEQRRRRRTEVEGALGELVGARGRFAGVLGPLTLRGDQQMGLADLTGGGHDPGRAESVLVQISEDRVGRALRTSRWKYVVDAPGADAWNEPDAEHYAETELYDLTADPYELDNLAGLVSHRAVADWLRAELLEWLARIEGVEPVVERAAPRPAGRRRAEPFPAGAPWEGVRFGHRPAL
ncbi:hypothetical protein [Streptomyces pratensis]|uniref:hypothetical protein n=1 Tax=Streptomyces pratensis TaxID=1169025 RepID=UPI001EE40A37|nr:hypothetical protein [Streptomyces pratensis]